VLPDREPLLSLRRGTGTSPQLHLWCDAALPNSQVALLVCFIQDVRNVELMWDQMWRGSMPYGRKGLAIQAISAVDLALWDCLGKLWKEVRVPRVCACLCACVHVTARAWAGPGGRLSIPSHSHTRACIAADLQPLGRQDQGEAAGLCHDQQARLGQEGTHMMCYKPVTPSDQSSSPVARRGTSRWDSTQPRCLCPTPTPKAKRA
jgi:hypothetical protein